MFSDTIILLLVTIAENSEASSRRLHVAPRPNNGRFYNDLLFQPGVQSLIKVAKFRGREFRIRLTNSICKF